MIGEVFGCDGRAIALGYLAWSAKDGLPDGTATAHGLGDPLSLQRVDKARGVAGEQYSASSGGRPNDAHLEPASEAPRRRQWRRVGEESEGSEVMEERRQFPDCVRSGLPVRERTDPEANIGAAF
jgi:hypothetical protein